MQLIFVPWVNVKENRKHERSFQSPIMGYLTNASGLNSNKTQCLTAGCQGILTGILYS